MVAARSALQGVVAFCIIVFVLPATARSATSAVAALFARHEMREWSPCCGPWLLNWVDQQHTDDSARCAARNSGAMRALAKWCATRNNNWLHESVKAPLFSFSTHCHVVCHRLVTVTWPCMYSASDGCSTHIKMQPTERLTQ